MRAFLALLFLCPAVAAQPASVDGAVVNAADSQPMSGVHISLMAMDAGNVKAAYGAVTDRAGHFSITGIAPDSYILLAERTGFLQARNPGDSPIPTVYLKAGQQLANFRIAMAARSVITGRVLDETGDPLPDVNVQALSSPDGPPQILLRGTPWVSTDDRGVFRIVVPPGKYYLKATPRAPSVDPAEIRSDGTADVTYGATPYPSPIEASAGGDITAIDIRLARLQSLSIGGTVTSLEGPSAATVWLQSKESTRTVASSANGRFAFSKLPAGSYHLFAQASGNPKLQSQILDLDLGSHEESNVQLALSPGGELSGQVEIEGEGTARPRSLRLEHIGLPLGDLREFSGGSLDTDNAFRIVNITPGRYNLRIAPLPPDAYIKSVVLDGAPLSADVLDFSRGLRSSAAKIVVGLNGGRLTGSVVDRKGEPSASLKTAVVLTANPAGLLDAQVQLPAPGGTFTFQGIRPGKYRLLAVDLLTIGGALDGDAMKALAAKAEEFEIKEGDRLNRNATLMMREDADVR